MEYAISLYNKRYVNESERIIVREREQMRADYFVSVRAEMTFPRADNDKLICLLSSNRCPVAPDWRTRSDPAKSTRFNFPTCQQQSVNQKRDCNHLTGTLTLNDCRT